MGRVSAQCVVIPESIPRATSLPSVEEVYDDHVEFVARFARGLGIPNVDLDDIIQDVFLVVVERLGEFENRSTIRTWMARITHNVVRTHRQRRHRRLRECVLDDEVDAAGKTPHDVALEREALATFRAILARMREDQRVVFWLAEVEGLEMPAIAESLGINLSTAYSRLRLARQLYHRAVEQVQAKDTWRSA